ncbi:hypothetical protein NQ318_000231 [Aromia moschata]|uniref:C2H2-type domain-containing protein n=1 Tax=Aromia moschata TaxID=1265417 RepID=A0AAV8X9V7_9CUCU|nr:hypothetical protein NQ318_000231 [Aromia moschata]
MTTADSFKGYGANEQNFKNPEKTQNRPILSEDTEIKSFVDISYKQETSHTSVNWDPNQSNQNGNEIKLEYPEDHKLIEDVAVTRYHCPYVTKQKGLSSRHVLIHRKSSEITTYDCSFCSYKANRKSELTGHMLTHKDISEVTTYQCAICPYKAKRKKKFNPTLVDS